MDRLTNSQSTFTVPKAALGKQLNLKVPLQGTSSGCVLFLRREIHEALRHSPNRNHAGIKTGSSKQQKSSVMQQQKYCIIETGLSQQQNPFQKVANYMLHWIQFLRQHLQHEHEKIRKNWEMSMKALFQQNFCPLPKFSDFFKMCLTHLEALATSNSLNLEFSEEVWSSTAQIL